LNGVQIQSLKLKYIGWIGPNPGNRFINTTRQMDPRVETLVVIKLAVIAGPRINTDNVLLNQLAQLFEYEFKKARAADIRSNIASRTKDTAWGTLKS
jgi:hypothetical protein